MGWKVLDSPYHDDSKPFEEEEEISGEEEETTTESYISGDEDEYTSTEEEIDSEFEDDDEIEETGRGRRTLAVEEEIDPEDARLSDEDKWQTCRIAMRAAFTLADVEGKSKADGITLKLSDIHTQAPWEKLKGPFKITSDSVLGSVRLTKAKTNFPAGLAYSASMVDPKNKTERVTRNVVLPTLHEAVSGYLSRGESISSLNGDDAPALVESPDYVKPTFLSNFKGATIEDVENGYHRELVDKKRLTHYRVLKNNPLFFSHIYSKMKWCEENGKKFNMWDYCDDSGEGCASVPIKDIEERLKDIRLDMVKNTTADFFHKNFSIKFERAWTEGHSRGSLKDVMSDKTELFDNVTTEAQKEKIKNQKYDIECEIQAEFYVGKLRPKKQIDLTDFSKNL